MIAGKVNAHCEAVVRVRVRGANTTELEVDAIVDTSFTADMTLPSNIVTALGLSRHSGSRMMLADGSAKQYKIYGAEVKWNGAWRPILIWCLGDEVLIGMQLVAGHELRIAVAPGGSVEIVPLP